MDGYPRTLAQAASFDQVLRQQFLQLNAVLLFTVNDEEIVRRMTGRWSCPQCKTTYHMVNNPPKKTGICDSCHSKLIQREDDREETVRERLKLYHQNTSGLMTYYQKEGLLHEIAGIGEIEDIYARILQLLKQAGLPC